MYKSLQEDLMEFEKQKAGLVSKLDEAMIKEPKRAQKEHEDEHGMHLLLFLLVGWWAFPCLILCENKGRKISPPWTLIIRPLSLLVITTSLGGLFSWAVRSKV